jgi:hypothetical protein
LCHYLLKLSIINFIINQASVAIANHVRAIIIVSFHFVFSLVREPNNILYAHIIMNIIAIVQDISSNKSMVDLIIIGISSICISHLLTFSLVNQVLPVLQKIHHAFSSAAKVEKINSSFIIIQII